MVDATADYRAAMDLLAPFFSECCIFAPEGWTASAELRAEYEHFCRERGEDAISGQAFVSWLRTEGLTACRRGHANTRGWLGVGLLTERDADRLATAATGATGATGCIGNSSSRTGIELKLPDLPVAGGRTAGFESEPAETGGRSRSQVVSLATCDDGCGAPVEARGELCDACVAAAVEGSAE